MGDMRMMPVGQSPGPASLLMLIIMWWVMMIAMMIPSAAPTILLYGHVHRSRVDPVAAPPTGAFLLGYLACWLIFSVAAAGAQSLLEQASLASPMTMALHSRIAGAALLIAAGLYQLSPLKDACLGKCRSPAQFLAAHYRPGGAGAFGMGLVHGAYCVGCCWLLMLLLFVGGVMNFAWIAVLALLVAAERLLPGGRTVGRLAGAALIASGVAFFAL